MLTFACGLNEFESFIIMFFNKTNTLWYFSLCALVYLCLCLCVCGCCISLVARHGKNRRKQSQIMIIKVTCSFLHASSIKPGQVSRMTGLSKFSQIYKINSERSGLYRCCKWSEEKNFYPREIFLLGWTWQLSISFSLHTYASNTASSMNGCACVRASCSACLSECLCVCLCALHAISNSNLVTLRNKWPFW